MKASEGPTIAETRRAERALESPNSPLKWAEISIISSRLPGWL